MIDNRVAATEYVTTAIESGAATADEFNIDGIVDALHNVADSWDFDAVDTDVFWQIVAANEVAA